MRTGRRTNRIVVAGILAAATALAGWSTPAASQNDAVAEAWAEFGPHQRGLSTSYASLVPVLDGGMLTAVLPGTEPAVNGAEIAFEEFSQTAFQMEGAPIAGSPFVDLFAESAIVFPSLSEAHFNTGFWVFNHAVLSGPPADVDTQVEVALFESIEGLPVFPPTEGFVTPDTVSTRATSVLFQDGDPLGLHFLGSDPGTPFGIPYLASIFVAPTPSRPDTNKVHMLWVTPDPDAVAWPTMTFATDPAGPETYRWRQIGGSTPTIFEIPTDLNPALAQVVEFTSNSADFAFALPSADPAPVPDPGVNSQADDPVQGADDPDPAADTDDGIPLGLLAVPIVLGGIAVGSVAVFRSRNPTTGEIDVRELQPLGFGRADVSIPRVVQSFLARGGTPGPQGLFVPTWEIWHDALEAITEGDQSDVLLLRAVAEHLTGREVGSSFPSSLRPKAGMLVNTDSAGTIRISGELPHSEDYDAIDYERGFHRSAEVAFPADSTLVVHAASGDAYWVPNDLMPPPTQQATLSGVADEVVCL